MEERIRLVWARLLRFGTELYGRTTAPRLRVRTLKAEVIETLLYGWTLARNTLLGSDRCTTRSSCEVLASGADRVPPTQPIRKRRPSRIHDARASRRPSVNDGISSRAPWHDKNEGRLRRRMKLGKMTGGEDQRPGGQPKSWHRCLLDNLKAFDATKRSPQHFKLFFGVVAEV